MCSQDVVEELFVKAKLTTERLGKSLESSQGKLELQRAYEDSTGLVLDANGSISLPTLHARIKAFCNNVALPEDHALAGHAHRETTAAYLHDRGFSLQIEDNQHQPRVLGIRHADDPGYKAELVREGLYLPPLGSVVHAVRPRPRAASRPRPSMPHAHDEYLL